MRLFNKLSHWFSKFFMYVQKGLIAEYVDKIATLTCLTIGFTLMALLAALMV